MNSSTNLRYSFPTTKEVTPEDIYENCSLKIPHGWEVIAFRPPVGGDKFWGVVDAPRVLTYDSYETWSSPQTPRLILKKTNEVVPTFMTGDVCVGDIYKNDVVIPEGWKFKRFGLPVAGDYYLNICAPRITEYWDKYSGKATSPRIIVTKA